MCGKGVVDRQNRRGKRAEEGGEQRRGARSRFQGRARTKVRVGRTDINRAGTAPNRSWEGGETWLCMRANKIHEDGPESALEARREGERPLTLRSR